MATSPTFAPLEKKSITRTARPLLQRSPTREACSHRMGSREDNDLLPRRAERKTSLAISASGQDFSRMRTRPVGQAVDSAPQEEEPDQGEVVVVGQGGATTPDGTTLGPTDPAQHVCLPSTRLIWVGGVGQNTATAATGRSRVTAHLGSVEDDEADCSCDCGLFRQFIRGFWRLGTPTSPKRHDIGSCDATITLSETDWTEEFEACNPGGAPRSADCDRVYLDAPGFAAGLSDGKFAEIHFDLRYQMWDQCRGVPVATGDRHLRISGDRHPRAITFD